MTYKARDKLWAGNENDPETSTLIDPPVKL